MKTNNNQRHDRPTPATSHYRKFDDFNILEPSPDLDLTSEDDEDYLSDYSLMNYDLDEDIDFDIDYDE